MFTMVLCNHHSIYMTLQEYGNNMVNHHNAMVNNNNIVFFYYYYIMIVYGCDRPPKTFSTRLTIIVIVFVCIFFLLNSKLSIVIITFLMNYKQNSHLFTVVDTLVTDPGFIFYLFFSVVDAFYHSVIITTLMYWINYSYHGEIDDL